MKLNKETLTEQQRTLEKEFWVEFYITKEKKLWMKSTPEYDNYIKKSDKKVAIEKIATITDQLNLMASVLDTITSDTPDKVLIKKAKNTFKEIKTILDK